MLIRATGWREPALLLAAAVVIAIGYPDGIVDRIGPLSFYPGLRVVLASALLIALACGITHEEASAPVLRLTSRARAVRALSLGVVIAAGVVIVALASVFGDHDATLALVRNALLLGAIALATRTLVGRTYAWAPVIVVATAGLLSPVSDEPWTLYALIVSETGSAAQVALSAAAFALGAGAMVICPRGHGYLVRRARG